MKKKERKEKSKTAVVDVQPAAPACTPTSESLPWWLIPSLLVATLLSYLPALKGPFLFDDLLLPPMNLSARMAWASYLRGFRPLYYIALNFDTVVFGPDSFVFHGINLCYHLVNGVLAYFVLRRVIDYVRPQAPFAAWAAGFGAGLFLLHPLQTESVAYIASRSEVMSVFFSWSALLLYLQDREKAPGPLRVLAIFALLLLGLMSKEHVVAVPAVFMLVDYYFRPGYSLSGLTRRWMFYLPILTGGIAAATYLLMKTGGTNIGAGAATSPLQYLLTQCKVLWVYLRLYVAPYGQNIDWPFPVIKNLFDPLALFGGAALIALCIAAWIYRKQYPLASIGWFVFLALLAPTSSFVPIADPLAERRLYLSSLGLLLIVMEPLTRMQWTAARKTALGAVLLACVVLTMNRAKIYSDPVAFWKASTEAAPQNGRAWFQYGYALYSSGRCDLAIPAYEKAASTLGRDHRLQVDWALALDCAGKGQEATDKLRKALEAENDFHGWALLGMVYGKQRLYDDALKALDQSIALRGDYDMSWFYRGNVFLASGRPAEASEAYRKALSINPQHRPSQEALIKAERLRRGDPVR